MMISQIFIKVCLTTLLIGFFISMTSCTENNLAKVDLITELKENNERNLIFSGLDIESNITVCAMECYHYYKVGDLTFLPILTLVGLCFCSSKDVNTAIKNAHRINAVPKLCDDEICMWDNFVSDSSFFVLRDYNVTFRISADFTDIVVPMKASIKFDQSDDFNNGSGIVTSYISEYSTKLSQIHTGLYDWSDMILYHPGYTKMFVTTNFNINKVFLQHFHSNVSTVYVDTDSSFYDSASPTTEDLVIGYGTEVMMKKADVNFHIDVNLIANDIDSYEIITSSELLDDRTDVNHHTEFLGHTHFEEDGLLKYIELNVNQTGFLRFMIARLHCTRSSACVRERQPLGLFHHVDKENVAPEQFEPIMEFIVTLKQLGHQVIDVLQMKMKMSTDYIIAIYHLKDEAVITRFSAGYNSVLNTDTAGRSDIYKNRFTYAITADTRKSPAIKFYTAKQFTCNLKSNVVENDTKQEFKYTIEGPLVTDYISFNDKFPIVKKLLSADFAANEPIDIGNGFYDVDDDFLKCSAVYNPSTDVQFEFSVFELNVTKTVTTPQTYAIFQMQLFPPGNYTFHVIASTGNSMVSASRNVLFLEKIGIFSVTIDKTYVGIEETFTLSIFINGGNRVELNVDFKDGNLNRKYYENRLTDFYYNTTHSYSDCNLYEIEVTARNDATNVAKFEKLNLPVLCAANGLETETFPMALSTGEIQVVIKKYLELNVFLKAGSYADYVVDWGDGSAAEKWKDNTIIPVRKTLFHSYNKVDSYTVVINVQAFNKNLTKTLLVDARECTPPYMEFSYGTKSLRMNITKAGKTLRASWSHVSSYCEHIAGSAFKTRAWILHHKINASVSYAPQKATAHSTEFMLNATELNLGPYDLELVMKYFDKNISYFAYINIIEIPLFATMDLGEYNDIPKFKLTSSGDDEIFYIFHISGEDSYDPEKSPIEMKYQWYCNVNSSNDLVEKMKLNVTTKLLCLSSALERVDSLYGGSTSKLTFNTSVFLENIRYNFRLVVSKDTRTSSTMGTINVLAGASPQILISCKSNCLEKINTMEQIQYQLLCVDCLKSLITIGIWKLTYEENGTMLEVSDDAYNSKRSSPNLAIRASSLKIDIDYILELRSFYSSRPHSVSTLKLKKATAGIPYGGTCEANVLSAVVLDPVFLFKCSNWRNNDGETYYDFYYNDFSKPKIEVTTTTTSAYKLFSQMADRDRSFISNVSLPVGLKSHNYTLQIVVKISNRFKSYAVYDKIHVQVFPKLLSTSTNGEGEGNNDEAINELSNLVDKTPESVQEANTIAQGTISALHSFKSQLQETVVVDPLTGKMDEQQAAKLEEEKKKTEEATKNMVGKLLDNLEAVAPQNLQDIAKTFETIASLSDDPTYLNENTSNAAVQIADKKLDSLETFSTESEVGAEQLQSVCKPILTTFENLLNKEIDMEDEILAEKEKTSNKATNATEEKEVNIRKNIEKLNVMIDRVGSTILKKKVIGEELTQLKTPTLKLSLAKVYAVNLNTSTQVDNNGFGTTMPDYTAFGFQPADAVTVQSLSYKRPPFIWGNNSQDLKSEVVGYTIEREDDGDLKERRKRRSVNLNNISEPIKMTMKNNVDSLKSVNISLFKPRSYKMHSMAVKDSCNLMLDIKSLDDDNNETTLFVYIQYGIKPATKDYDILLQLSASHGLIIQQNTKPSEQTFQNKTETFPRKSFIRKIDDGSLVIWNFKQFTLASLVKDETEKFLHFTFVYFGEIRKLHHLGNPYTYDSLDVRSSYDYSLKAFCAACGSWNSESNIWETDELKIDFSKASFSRTSCETKQTEHTSGFGGIIVAPNPLPPLSFALLKEGFVLLATVLAVILLWMLATVVTRRADRKDLTKIGVCPLIDNKVEDKYLYEITINTGTRNNAGTDSKIYMVISGANGDTRIRKMKDPYRKTFQQSSSDVFIMKTPFSLGELSYIRLWHDNSGGDWYIRSVEIVDLALDEKYLFLVTRWLAIDKHDGMLDCLVPVATKSELTDFNYLFTTKSQQDFSDVHVWYSIYARSPRSVFTRTQRLAVAISLLFCSMTASLMFYGAIPAGSAADENRVGSFKFTWAQVYVAFITACITIPVNFILTGIFRSIQSKQPDVEVTDTNDKEKNADIKDTSENKKTKKKFAFPHWVLYPTWVLCILLNLGFGFLVVWYGMAFGNKKSIEWLGSVTICLFQDIVLMQPVKVFLFALFVGLVVKKLDNEEKSEIEKQAKRLAQDESWLDELADEMNDVMDRVEVIQPLCDSKLHWMREIRLKEIRMHAIIREIILYVFFAAVVFLIGYLNRDKSAFYQTQGIEELLSLRTREGTHLEDNQQYKKILSYSDFWPWIEDYFLDEVFPTPWYKLDPMYSDTPDVRDFPGKFYLNDLTSKVVNGIRIRQVRVQPDKCGYAAQVTSHVTARCSAKYSSSTEETRHFKSNWSIPYASSKERQVLSAANKPWNFQTWDELDGYPVWAELNTFYGGGYVAEIFPRWKNKEIMNSLKEKHWIDRYTRAVIIEFTIYNGATNYFTAITVVLEFPPGGGAVHYFGCNTVQLYRYANHSKIFVISCEILFLVLMLIFTYREFRLIHKLRWVYFKEFWNLVEISNICLTVVACGIYVYREILASTLLSKLPEKRPDVFINFQFASTWGSLFTYVIALICFFVTLKFMKLLRFNRRISLLSHTLKRASYPLAMFGICFGIVIVSFIFSSTIMFGNHLYGYRNTYHTVASIIGLLLGKFSYEQFENSNRLLGPIFFMAFNIMVNIVLMNMMISILDDSFKEVQEEVLAQSNDYEIVDFVMSKFKEWFGLGTSISNGESEWRKRSFIEQRKSPLLTQRSGRPSSARRSVASSSVASSNELFGVSTDLSHWLNNDVEHDFLQTEHSSVDGLDETAERLLKSFSILNQRREQKRRITPELYE